VAARQLSPRGRRSAALQRDLPRRFYRRLPFVREGQAVVARVEALARAFIRHTDSRVDRGPMLGYLAFQTVAPLTPASCGLRASCPVLRTAAPRRRRLAAREARRAADAYLDANGPGGFRAPVWPALALDLHEPPRAAPA
jgi:hypothetical protein